MGLRPRRKEFRGQLERPDYGRILIHQREDGYFRKLGDEKSFSPSVKMCRRIFVFIAALLLLGGVVFTLF